MKKIINLSMFLWIGFLLTGCMSSLGNRGNLKSVVSAYQSEMNDILDENQNAFNKDKYKLTSDYLENQMYSKSDYLEVYNVQRDNTLDVKLDEILSMYKEILDEAASYLDEHDIDSVKADIELDLDIFGKLDVEVFISSQGSLVFILNTNDLAIKRYGVKLGYENEDFYIREFIEYDGSNSYTYFEFLENNYLINVRLNSDNMWYRYQNQNDLTYYEYSENLFNGELVSSSIRWYNPETKVRTTISDSERVMHFVEFFNPKGIYFSYMNYLDDNQIELRYQLLEATGWTDAFATYTNHPDRGVYNNGVKLFDENVRVGAYINSNFANVSATMTLSSTSQITPELLTLSMYGLDFNHPEITMDYITTTLHNTKEDSNALRVYRGIDFSMDDVNLQLFELIDQDLKA